MAKLKTGEWFQDNLGRIGVVVNARPDRNGDVFVSVMNSYGERSTNWPDKSVLGEYQHTEGERFVLFRTAKRSDGFKFRALYAPNGRSTTALVVAGCRAFTIAEAKAHWKARNRTYLTEEGKGTDNKALNAWSLAYVKEFEAHLKLVRAGTVR